jgi:5-methylcytosine-specific restriction endonuclease McrA
MQQAREIDHVIPVRVAPERRLDADNLQSLCWSHHRIKTAKDKDRFK